MMWWGNGYMMGWWWIGVLVVVLIIVAVVAIVLAATRSARTPSPASMTDAPSGTSGTTPRQILDERYAKGELTTEEYQERLRVLGA